MNGCLPIFVFLFGIASSFRMMSFNVWNSGRYTRDGLHKIAAQIKAINPDAVALQEIRAADDIAVLVRVLGEPWAGTIHCNLDTAVLSRHTIVPGSYAQVDRGMHVQIERNGRKMSIWSLHLEHTSYGPYAAQSRLVKREKQILAGEMPSRTVGRVHNIVQLLQNPDFISQIHNADTVPVIVAGDFNTPSDEDWTEHNRNQHGDWRIEWPTTKLLRETAGMTDSFRQVFEDPVEFPGTTWSVFKHQSEWDFTIAEPEDRIDFIFYRGPIKPYHAFTYSGRGPLQQRPNQQNNEWPSDHYAVITEFEEVSMKKTLQAPMRRIDEKYLTKHSGIRFKANCSGEIVHAFGSNNKLDRKRRHPFVRRLARRHL